MEYHSATHKARVYLKVPVDKKLPIARFKTLLSKSNEPPSKGDVEASQR